jgi:hypothetical protein
VYSNSKTSNTAILFGGIGLYSVTTKLILVVVIFGVALTIFSLLKKRIAIEPIHYDDGSYRWALTKNGRPLKRFGAKKKKKTK